MEKEMKKNVPAFSGRKPYKLLLLDFDGTLAELDLPWDELKKDVRMFAEREKLKPPEDTGFSAIVGAYEMIAPLPAGRKALLRKELSALNDRYERMAAIKLLVDKNLYAEIRKKFRVCVISNNGKAVIVRGLKENGLAADAIISRDDVTRLKPSKEGIEKALEMFHLSPAEAAFIGDGTYDERAATAAGVDFIGVHSLRLRNVKVLYNDVNGALRALLMGVSGA